MFKIEMEATSIADLKKQMKEFLLVLRIKRHISGKSTGM